MDNQGNFLGFRASNRDITDSKLAEERLRDLGGRLINAQEEERRLIARELHDDLAQRLAVLAIEGGKLEQELDSSVAVYDRLLEMREQIVKLLADIHAISRQLHPSILDDLGLVDAVQSECASFAYREGIVVNYKPKRVRPTIPKNLALCIYRIIQEGLRNIAKHARATEAHVSLVDRGDRIDLSIHDNGRGFDTRAAKKKPGLGLASMEERVRLIQGEITVKSKPGEGTVIKVRAPLSGKGYETHERVVGR